MYTERKAHILAQQKADETNEAYFIVKRAERTHNEEGTAVFDVEPKKDVWLTDEDDVIAEYRPRP